MSDRPEGSGGSRSADAKDERGGGGRKPPRPVRPPGGSSDAGRRAAQASRKKKPTPVRDLATTEVPSSPTEPDLDEARVSAGDEAWVVRVLGRGGGKANAATPLLLLGFWKEDEGDGAPDREALVVGRTLASLTVPALRAALESSDPYRPRADAPRESARRGRRAKGRRGSSRNG